MSPFLAACMMIVSLSLWAPLPSLADAPISRLNQSLRRPAQAFLPPRLTIGQDNVIAVRGTPGTKVILLYAAELAESPLVLPNGQQLQLPLDSPRVEAVLSDKGAASLVLPVPNKAELADQTVQLAVLSYQAEDKSDIQRVQLLDASGRPTQKAALTMVLLSEGEGRKGPSVMPMMPGMDPSFMRQVTTAAELSQNKEKRERLWDDGQIHRELKTGRNSLYNAPGSAGFSPSATTGGQ